MDPSIPNKDWDDAAFMLLLCRHSIPVGTHVFHVCTAASLVARTVQHKLKHVLGRRSIYAAYLYTQQHLEFVFPATAGMFQ